ncbi:MAG: fused response regulator/phosphatase [Pseudomonadota bacterium]
MGYIHVNPLRNSNLQIADVAPPDDRAVQTILVVDDSAGQRKLLSKSLQRNGFDVIEAASGQDALDLCQSHSVDLVISDWMMPGMDGIEFCRAFRKVEKEGYGYFILLTSKAEKADIAKGLDAGADDFLTKPFIPAEILARIRAGDRIVDMQRRLTEKNSLLAASLDELKELYSVLDNDLLEARKLQQSLVPQRFFSLENADVSLLLKPSGHVGGDLVGFFPINEQSVGFYSIDVSGHGVSSALLTARLAAQLSAAAPEQNVALTKIGKHQYAPRAPADAVSDLNKLIQREVETEHYFTIALAHFNLVTGEGVLCQAGHPHPLLHRADGAITSIGDGGLPVGLLPSAEFENVPFMMRAGDRLVVLSDGVIECANPSGHGLDDDGVAELLRRNHALKGQAFMEALMWDLSDFAGGQDMADDISGVLFEYKQGLDL